MSMEQRNQLLANEYFHIKNCVHERYDDENAGTQTSFEQINVEKSVERAFGVYLKTVDLDPEAPVLAREHHIKFLTQYLSYLPHSYECLDASRAWLCYWIVHALYLLKYPISSEDKSCVVQFLGKCQNENGGFGGGPGQFSHLAPTYAAVNTLVTLGTEEAFNVINRESLKKFLKSMRDINGAFCMHVGGEVDIRGLYCALSIARITNIYSEDLFDKSAEWVTSCQTYEGGFSGSPGMEAHGGYTFCGIAALSLLGRSHLCDMKALLRWTVNRQMCFEGGFQGRTNKLVDGCYSFWQGGAMAVIHRLLLNQCDDSMEVDNWLFQSKALQNYVILCCQHPLGGLIDKPNKPRDVYHTCYTLSGLSVAQHLPSGVHDVIGTYENTLEPLHPVYNIGLTPLRNALDYFMQCP